MENFKSDYGFGEPIKTKKECNNPEFANHNLHRVAIMKDYHIGSKGDIDEGGLPGFVSKKVCVGCGMEFKGIGFYPDNY
jgi:hypothetical protein